MENSRTGRRFRELPTPVGIDSISGTTTFFGDQQNLQFYRYLIWIRCQLPEESEG